MRDTIYDTDTYKYKYIDVMSKLIKYSLFGLIAVILAFFLVYTLFLNSIVRTGIETVGSQMTQTVVTVENVSLSLFSGQGTIEGLKVDNPEGFKTEHAVVIQSMDISVDITSLLSDKIIINEINITNPVFSVIQKIPENNLMMLMNNMKETQETETESEAYSTAMVIEYLVVKDGRISVSPNIGSNEKRTVGMGTIELTDIGTENDVPVVQTVRKVASAVVKEVLVSALGGELKDLKNKAKDAVKDIFNRKNRK